MIDVNFFIKSVVKWSEKSVRFEFFMGIAFQMAQFCEILSHSLRYGTYASHLSHTNDINYNSKSDLKSCLYEKKK